MSKPWDNGKLKVSDNGRFLQHDNGQPFFWLGDTAWLLFTRLTREEVIHYLDNRRDKGYNVIQVMVIHTNPTTNVYGRQAFIDGDFTKPDLDGEYSYWDHVDYVVDQARERGLYMAMVCVWGSVVKDEDAITPEVAAHYGTWLAERYRDRPNMIWLNGGDLQGDVKYDTWISMGKALRAAVPDHLVTYHPFGRSQSSTWFHHEEWLDFNMIQSGHSRYDQIRKDSPSTWKGEDNWRYVSEDYARWPAKPTIDAEPSYEDIPHGLHYTAEQPTWQAPEIRRYAYWAVFAGAFGHTYGQNAVMQMYKPEYNGAYNNSRLWSDGLDDPGAYQMIHLKNLILSRPFFERIPDQTVIVGDPGYRHNYTLVTRGTDYLFAYTYTGQTITVSTRFIQSDHVVAYWFNPECGESTLLGTFENNGTLSFTPPGGQEAGNDWVLVLDDVTKGYLPPGQFGDSDR